KILCKSVECTKVRTVYLIHDRSAVACHLRVLWAGQDVGQPAFGGMLHLDFIDSAIFEEMTKAQMACAMSSRLVPVERLIVELAESGDEDAAIAQLTTLIKDNSKNSAVAFAHLQLGQLLAKKGAWQSACEHYREAARQPNYVEAHLKLADALVHEGHRSEAL